MIDGDEQGDSRVLPVAYRGRIRRHPWRSVLTSVGLLALAGALTVAVHFGNKWADGDYSGHTISGSVTVYDATARTGGCKDGGDLASDVSVGSNIQVQNTTGKVLAVSVLGDGTSDGTDDGGCVWPFTVTGVPKTAIYQFKVGDVTRQGLDESYSDLSKDNGHIGLKIGEPVMPTPDAAPSVADTTQDAAGSGDWCSDLAADLQSTSSYLPDGSSPDDAQLRELAEVLATTIADEAPVGRRSAVLGVAAQLSNIADGDANAEQSFIGISSALVNSCQN